MAWVVRRTGAGAVATLGMIPARAHLLALAAFTVEILARAARVAFAARGLEVPLTLRASLRAQLAADAVAAVTPSRVGSDPTKIAVLKDAGVRVGAAGALLVAEMAGEMTVLVVLGLLVAAGVGGAPWVAVGVLGYVVLVAAGIVAALLAARWPGEAPPPLWTRVGLRRGRWRALRAVAAEFLIRTHALRRLPARWVVAILAATGLHIAARLAVLPLLVLPLVAGGAATIAVLPDLVLRPFFVLYATALLPPPGGGGGVEIVFAALLDTTLAPGLLAAALLWWRVYTFYLGAALGALLLVVPGLRRLPAD
ncbi:MAG: flippase-like domain-containing protein [Gemmatimonadetes bacterium]|nr:flippase-like domain-containing protein [Gemmatimonadota bacterium]